MIRRRAVYPDQIYETIDGREVPVVSDEHLINEVAKLLPMINFAGGSLTVMVDRAPTGLEHEMVTHKAGIQWQDRTDARPQRETAQPVEAVRDRGDEIADALGPEEFADAVDIGVEEVSDLAAARAEVARTTDPDEEEDLSSIPVEAR